MKIATLDSLISGDRYDPILIVGKTIGLEWATVRALILLRLGPNRVPAPADIETARVNFATLMPSTAERVVSFWKARQSTRGRTRILPNVAVGALCCRCKGAIAAATGRSMLAEAAIQSHAEKIRDDGYTVIEGAASPDLVEGLKQAVRAHRARAQSRPRQNLVRGLQDAAHQQSPHL